MEASPTVDTDAVSVAHDRFWDSYSSYYDAIYRLIPYRGLLWDAFQALELEPEMRLLDAGCGSGNLEHFIGQKPHPPVHIDAVDFSPGMLERGRVKCADLDYVRFAQADLSARLPFEDATFDRVVSVHVLYALGDQDATVRELLRVLKPDGILVIANPTPEFAAPPLVVDHLRRIRNIWTFARKAQAVLAAVAALGTSVGMVALNSAVINRREREGTYHSMSSSEFRAFLERRRADGVTRFDIHPAMAEQSLLATASKAAYAA